MSNSFETSINTGSDSQLQRWGGTIRRIAKKCGGQTRLCISFIFLILSTTAFAQTTDSARVKQVFEDYKTAILSDKGEAAVSLVDRNTINYYGRILDLSKTADSPAIAALPLLDKFMVLTVKHRTAIQDILKFDGKDLLIFAIKSGMVGKGSVANNTLGSIRVTGDSASAQVVVSGKPSPLYFTFHKEETKWKLDLTSIFPASNLAFKRVVDQSGKNESEFLIELLKNLTGRDPGPEIWLPVKP